MILSFGDRATARLFSDEWVRKFDACERSARKKLEILHAATSLEDLRVPPGNRLEQLKGELYPKWSIRINDQWRLVFLWANNNAYEVEIIDYH